MREKAAYLGSNCFFQRADAAKEYATMLRCTNEPELLPLSSSRDVLTDVLRRGANELLAQAVEAEVDDWIEGQQSIRNETGHRQVVRNG